jgi:predicted PurR-regulated permease PerM
MTDSNKWLILSSTLLLAVLIYLLAPILTPFMMAALLAYIGDPLVDRLQKWRLSRTLAVVTVFFSLSLLLTIGLVILVPLLERQVVLLANNIPGYIDVVQTQFIPWLQTRFALDINLDTETLKSSVQSHWREAGGLLGTLVSYISRSSLVLVGWLANLVLIPLVTFYLLRDWDVMVARIHELLPRRIAPVIGRLAKSSDEVLGAFLRGQLLVMLALALIYSVGLSIVGLELGLLIGLLAGLVSFVPYLGVVVGLIAASIAGILQFHDSTQLLYIAIVFGVGQLVEGMLLTPLLVGDRIGLHPVAVIFAVMAGGQLFGFLGILLALPVAAVIVVFVRYVHERYMASTLYSKS